MNDTTQHHAYQRGVRMATLWKRIKSSILNWDSRCVSKARSHKLPGWIGHIPTVFLASGLILFLFGYAIVSFARASCMISLWAITYIAKNIFRPIPVEITNWNENKKSSYERFSWENEQHKNVYDKQSWHQND